MGQLVHVEDNPLKFSRLNATDPLKFSRLNATNPLKFSRLNATNLQKFLPAKVSGYTVVPRASCVKLIVCKLSVCFFSGSVFSINATTGVVTVTGSVNFEMGQEHELSVEASDRGNPRRSQVAALHVLIRNEEDESPRFPISFYTASINEGTRVTYPCLHT